MAEGDQRLLTHADDDFHPPIVGEWWSHETCWFWFSVPERALGAWVYNWIRPNIGVTGGGVTVWDATTSSHWEAPYHSNASNLRLPDERDLRRFTFPTGVSVEMLEPLQRYRIGFAHEPMLSFALEFDAVMEPWVSVRDVDGDRTPYHFDQFGRVTGSVELHGEHLEVDCLAIRDRTWAVRSERWKHGGGYGYTSAAAESGEAFLVIGDEASVQGFVVLDGRRAGLRAGDAAGGTPSRARLGHPRDGRGGGHRGSGSRRGGPLAQQDRDAGPRCAGGRLGERRAVDDQRCRRLGGRPGALAGDGLVELPPDLTSASGRRYARASRPRGVVVQLGLSEDQELFRATTAKFLDAESASAQVRRLADERAGFTSEYWRRAAELGWTTMLVAEADGGGSLSRARASPTSPSSPRRWAVVCARPVRARPTWWRRR